MDRSALKPIVSTSLMAIAAVLFWMFWIGDPCLKTHIANHWAKNNPPIIAPTPASASTDYVVVENPYGIMTCHYQTTGAGQVLNVSVFAIVVFAIRWLTARRITRRPLFIAAAITTLAMMLVLPLQYWVHWEDVKVFHSDARVEFLRFQLLALLVFLFVASGIAMLGAWITIRFSRRP